jgi:RimJ/RimL family protein N-acetyltransferase
MTLRQGAWWRDGEAELRIGEPTAAEVTAVAPRLTAFYNEPHNKRLLANTLDLTAQDVSDFYRQVRADGGHTLLLWRDGVLMGDADFRRVDAAAGTAEFAILIGERAAQGQGMGTRFATMAHALIFATLPLARVYVSIVAGNAASLRLFQKLGYQRDDSPQARAGADDATDVTLSVTRAAFREARAEDVAGIAFRERVAER